MKSQYNLKINENGIDQVNYKVLERPTTFIAKVAIKIKGKEFNFKKQSDCIRTLNRKVNTTIRNLRVKSSFTKGRYGGLDFQE